MSNSCGCLGGCVTAHRSNSNRSHDAYHSGTIGQSFNDAYGGVDESNQANQAIDLTRSSFGAVDDRYGTWGFGDGSLSGDSFSSRDCYLATFGTNVCGHYC